MGVGCSAIWQDKGTIRVRGRSGRVIVVGVIVLLAAALFGDRVLDVFSATTPPTTQAASVSSLLPAQSRPVLSTPATTSGTASTGTSASITIRATTTGARSDVVDWSDALDHVGEKVTVEGPVAGTAYAQSSKGSPTFLNLGRDYPDPDRCTIIIWVPNRAKFPSAPEDAYRGKTIRIAGTVAVYKGCAQIEVKSPGQIEIVP